MENPEKCTNARSYIMKINRHKYTRANAQIHARAHATHRYTHKHTHTPQTQANTHTPTHPHKHINTYTYTTIKNITEGIYLTGVHRVRGQNQAATIGRHHGRHQASPIGRRSWPLRHPDWMSRLRRYWFDWSWHPHRLRSGPVRIQPKHRLLGKQEGVHKIIKKVVCDMRERR